MSCMEPGLRSQGREMIKDIVRESITHEQRDRNRNHDLHKSSRMVTDRLEALSQLRPGTGMQKIIIDVHERIYRNTGLNASLADTDKITNKDYCSAIQELMEEI